MFHKNFKNKLRKKHHICDINYEFGFRGQERLIYSNDGLIFKTVDHYNSFIVIE